MMIALRGEVDVLAGDDGAGVVAAEDGVFGGGDGDACWATELELGFAVGGDFTLAAMISLDRKSVV